MINEKRIFDNELVECGLLSAEIFISTEEGGGAFQIPTLTEENSQFLQSWSQVVSAVELSCPQGQVPQLMSDWPLAGPVHEHWPETTSKSQKAKKKQNQGARADTGREDVHSARNSRRSEEGTSMINTERVQKMMI